MRRDPDEVYDNWKDNHWEDAEVNEKQIDELGTATERVRISRIERESLDKLAYINRMEVWGSSRMFSINGWYPEEKAKLFQCLREILDERERAGLATIRELTEMASRTEQCDSHTG